MTELKELPPVVAYTGTIKCIDVARHLPFNMGMAFTLIWETDFDSPQEAIKDLKKASYHIQDHWLNMDKDDENPFPIANVIFSTIDMVMSPNNTGNRLALCGHIVSGAVWDLMELLDNTLDDLKKATQRKKGKKVNHGD